MERGSTNWFESIMRQYDDGLRRFRRALPCREAKGPAVELDLACGIFDLKNEASERAAERSLVQTDPVSWQGATYGLPGLALRALNRNQCFSGILAAGNPST